MISLMFYNLRPSPQFTKEGTSAHNGPGKVSFQSGLPALSAGSHSVRGILLTPLYSTLNQASAPVPPGAPVNALQLEAHHLPTFQMPTTPAVGCWSAGWLGCAQGSALAGPGNHTQAGMRSRRAACLAQTISPVPQRDFLAVNFSTVF